MSATLDLVYHEITGAYAMFMMGMSGILVYVFAFIFYNMGDSYWGFECDVESVDKSAYAGIGDIVKLIKDQKSCLENI